MTQVRAMNLTDLFGGVHEKTRSQKSTRKYHVTINYVDGTDHDLGEMTEDETLYVQAYSLLDERISSLTVIITLEREKENVRAPAIPNADEIAAAERVAPVN